MLQIIHQHCTLRISQIFLALTIIAFLTTSGSWAEPADENEEVRPVAYSQQLGAPNAAGNQTVQFSQLPASVGDLVIQDVRAKLDFSTTITQAGQVAHHSDNSMVRRQERGIEVLEVVDDRVRRAKVAYRTSQQKIQTGSGEAKMSTQPVEGMSYLVTRNGEGLVITDLDGNIPPQEQFIIVTENMQTLGMPNPLAKYLLGRQFAIGERLALPQKLAEELLGLGDPFGKVQAFELELLGTEVIDQQPCASFAVKVEAVASDQGEMNLKIEGRMAIQLATCRTVAAELSGPIGMSAEEKTGESSYQYSAEGGMTLAIHSTYTRSADN